MRNFEELSVWQDARLLVNDIYKMTATCKVMFSKIKYKEPPFP